jgi:hypothetical protein
VVYWYNSYTIVHFSLDIVEWFMYKLKKVFKLYLILIHPPLSINKNIFGGMKKDIQTFVREFQVCQRMLGPHIAPFCHTFCHYFTLHHLYLDS